MFWLFNIIVHKNYWIDKPSIKCGVTPLTGPSSLALSTMIANISTMMLKRIGDKESPGRRLFWFGSRVPPNHLL